MRLNPRTLAGPSLAAMLALMAAALLVVICTFRSYGISWDEGVQSRYGELVLQYFATGNQRYSTFSNLRYYGPGFELLSAGVSRLAPDSLFEIRHLLSAMAAVLAIPPLYLVGRRLGSGWIGVLAGLALLLMPRFYGHAFINSKDIPFACAFAWTMAALIACFDSHSKPWRAALLLGFATGIMLTIRPAGLPLVALIAAALLAWHIWIADNRRLWRSKVLELASAFVLSWVIMVLPWPFAHENPVLNPLRAIIAAVRFDVAYPVLFEGVETMSNQLPARYLPEYILITTPLFVLAFSFVGLLVSVWAQRKEPRSPRAMAIFLVQVWLLLPLAACVIQRPNVYDGLRHFLFLMPAIALLFAHGVFVTVRLITPPRPRLAVIGLVVLLTCIPVPQLVMLHPYQVTFFNSLVGGLHGAAGRYETDYWITSYCEAMAWISQQAQRDPDHQVTVLVAAPKNALATVERRAPNVRVVLTFQLPDSQTLPAQFDYYIGSTRYGWDRAFPKSPVAHSVGREGALFAVVRSRQP